MSWNRKIFAALIAVVSFAGFFSIAYAGGSASVAALNPSSTVPIGAHVTFSILSSGFTNPTYYLVDSFPGGANTSNLDSLGNFSWTPNKDDIGTHTLTVTVSDSSGNTATASQTIVVSAPSIAIQSLVPASSVNIGTPVSFTVVPSGFVSPTYSVGDSFANSSMRPYNLTSTGAFAWTPIGQDVGVHTVVVTASDQYGNAASTSVQITVLPNVSLFTLGLAGKTVNVGQKLAFAATSTGFVSPAYAISDAFSSIGSSTLAIDALGNVTWTPVYNDIGVHPITITASDSTGRSTTYSLAITVAAAGAASALQAQAPASAPATSSSIVTAPASQPVFAPQPAAPAAPAAGRAAQPAAKTSAASAPTASSSVQAAPATLPFPQLQSAPSAPAANTGPAATSAANEVPPIPPSESFGQYLLQGALSLFTWIPNLFR